MGERARETPLDASNPALSSSRPIFVDNRAGNTLDRAIIQHLQTLQKEMALPWELCISSAYFNVPGFRLLADELEKVGHVRLLLGAEPTPEAVAPERKPGDPEEPDFTRSQVAKALEQLGAGLRRAGDLLPFDQDSDGAVRRLLEHLHAGKMEVRLHRNHFLHAKAFIFRVVGGGSLVGSSNFTYGGMRGNLELNLGQYLDPVVGKVEGWFDELWEQAEPFDLADIYDRLLAEYPPYLIYLKVLYHLYGAELAEEDQEVREAGQIPVTTFQRHGAWRALRILHKYGGVLIADGVGLGKTFIAGEIMQLYREKRQRVLLVCPAALRDSTWRKFIEDYQIYLTCLSYEQLARDRQLGGDQDHLRSNKDEYALVVVDEAHNYRNPDAPARAEVLRKLLMGQRRDLLLMTATPVNNSLWDLYHELRYFLKRDSILADRGVLSIRARFDDAMEVDPFDLSPDLLYPVIDATTVKRTRQFIKKHYANDLIRMPDGKQQTITFPKPVASSITYDLEKVLPGFLDEVEAALMPPHGHPKLTMARYKPENYPAGTEPNRGDPAIVGLVRSGLLKRFESSVHAFAKTLDRMIREHDFFLAQLDEGRVVLKEILREVSLADDEEVIEELLERSPHVEPAAKYNVGELRKDVRADREILQRLHKRAERVRSDTDPKLAVLLEELRRIVRQAEEDGLDEEDRRRKRKVLVFSAFADTIDWIGDYLGRQLDRSRTLRRYQGRMASVAGGDSRDGVTREAAIYGFAPTSTGAPPGRQDDLYDLLLSTDVLAEGMNLQECGNIINYDLPWNPMRLVQRHGRIDRIGSRHDRVFLRTCFPDKQLDRLLNLEQRVRQKLAQAAASIGIEIAPIERGATGQQVFAETKDEIEKLLRGDAGIYEAGGTASAAQTGEEYRQELRRALKRMGDEIRNLPWKAGSGMAKGKRRGHFFCAMIGKRVYLRFVPFGEPDAAIVKELGTCLRMIECGEDKPLVMPMDLKQTAFSAWERARRDIHGAWTHETDPRNLQPRVPKLNLELARFLRKYPPGDVDQSRLEKCLDAIEAPCSRREENMLRETFETEYPSAQHKARAILSKVEEIGLEPFEAPEPLPAVKVEDVHLVCWMAMEKGDNAQRLP